MDINSGKMSKLLQEIEKIRRRKIVDYKYIEELHYVDPDDNLSKLSIHNNHLIFGRRGSGKTTLVLATLRENKNDIPSVQDAQSIKDYDSNSILIRIVLKTLLDVKEQFLEQSYDKTKKEYLEQFKGFSGILRWFIRKRNNNVKEDYLKSEVFLQLLNKTIESFQTLKDMPEVITYMYSIQDTRTTKNKVNYIKNINTKGTFELQTKLQSMYNPYLVKLNGLATVTGEYKYSKGSELSHETKFEAESKNMKEYRKKDLIKETKEVLTFIFDEFNKIVKKNIVLYIDDFYQIPIERQPYIIQYLHDVYKNCHNYSFCFKICSLPFRLRMNKKGQVDLSYKDDFSPIKLDNDLSELNMTKDYLLKILTYLKSDLNITKQEIEALFNNEEVLLYSIIATGGVPRDFLLVFADLVRTARSDNRSNIIKEHVYSVVKNLRDDKDNNIEYDADVNPELIRNAIKILNEEVIEELKTNVILYPKKLAEKHDVLLKNLVNLRYLHVIKDSTSSEIKKKEEFTAYLIDMSFYAVNRRMKPGFDFRRFWEKDKESRLNQLRTSKIWNFPEWLFSQSV